MGKKKQSKKNISSKPAKPVEKYLPQDDWLVWLIFAILVLVPLVISRVSFDQFDIIKMAVFKVIILALVIIWISRMLTSPKPIMWSWREGLLVLFLIVGVMSVLTSIHIPTALHGKYKRYEGFLTFVSYISVYFIALQTFRKRGQVRTLLEVITFTGAIVSFYEILQFIGLDPINWGDVPFEQRRSFSTFGNPDLLAGYLVLALPCALVMFFDDTNRRWLHGGGFFIIAVGLITALTRSGWIGAIVGIVATLILVGRALKEHRRELAIVGAAFAVVLVAVSIYSASVPSLSVTKKFKGAFTLSSGTAANRFEIWKAGWFMVKERPLFGQGLDTYRLASEKHETKRYVSLVRGGTVSDNAHNYFIQLAAGGGPLAAVLMFGFFFAWIWRMVQVRPRAPDESSRLYIIGGAAGARGYLATMMFGISIVGATSTFWLLMGALSGYTSRLTPEYKRADAARWNQGAKMAASLSLLLVSLAIAGFSVAMYVGDIYFVQGLKAQGRNVAESHAYMDKARRLYPGNGRVPSRLGQIYLNWANQAINAKNTEQFQLAIDRSIESFKIAVEAEPLEADYKVFLANAYGNQGKLDEAISVLEEVIDRRPYTVPGNYLAGQFKERANRKQEAIAHYELAYELSPNYMSLPSMLAKLYQEVGNQAKAAEYQKIAAEAAKQ